MHWRHVELLPLAGAWGVAALLLGWAYLADAWRRALALLASAAGLVFLIMAVNTEGLREASTVSDFLLGPSYALAQTSASASLPYYVLTAVCLMLGLAGLAIGERAADVLRRHPLAAAVGLTLAVALLRFGFEKAAAPPALSRLFGVTWLAPVVGAFLFLNLRCQAQAWRRLTHALLAYAALTRGLVVAIYVVASVLRLGTHYDVVPFDRLKPYFGARPLVFEPGSVTQFLSLVLAPQLTFWVVYTLALGLLGAVVVGGVCRLARHARTPGEPAEDARLAPPGRIEA